LCQRARREQRLTAERVARTMARGWGERVRDLPAGGTRVSRRPSRHRPRYAVVGGVGTQSAARKGLDLPALALRSVERKISSGNAIAPGPSSAAAVAEADCCRTRVVRYAAMGTRGVEGPYQGALTAFQNPMLALLHQTHAPFVVTVLAMVFTAERSRVAVADAHAVRNPIFAHNAAASRMTSEKDRVACYG
jgi:hypothetical protein